MQQLANLVVLAPALRSDPLLKLGTSLLKLGKRGKGDGDEGVERLLDKGVELLSRSVKDA